MYDIPSGKKKERDWFRRQLIKFEYIMIQKVFGQDLLHYQKTFGLSKGNKNRGEF